MHDFHYTKADEMHFSILADRIRFFKGSQKGRDIMCAIIEEYAENQMDAAVIRGFQSGIFTKDNVREVYPKLKKKKIDSLYNKAFPLEKEKK